MKLSQPCIHLLRDGRFWAVFFLTFTLILAAGWLPAVAQGNGDLPTAPPDTARGLEIFDARCANCHGAQGNGDGELAANLPMPPRAFTDPTFRRSAVPASFYDLIFNGNLAAGMPGFGEGVNTRAPLSDEEIWQSIAAVMSLATPGESVALGQSLYAANCQACHGENGLGDGPEAANLPAPLASLANVEYWFTRSNDMVVDRLAPGALNGHDYDLSREQLTAVVDYARTFSYEYIAPASIEPAGTIIPASTISGVVSNATNGDLVGGVTVQLRAFSTSIEEMLILTETVGVDGSFSFTLGPVPAEWVYLVSVAFEGLNFSSEVGQLSSENPNIELPVRVYNQSTDPAIIRVAQVHVVFDFLSPQILQVTELYVYENVGTAVFVGESGNPEAGVTRVDLPVNAQNISFQRAFSVMDGFIPAPEVIPLTDGFADTVPLRPGRSNASLVVNYTLPYANGAELIHRIPYAIASATVILPDVGVSLVNADGWTAQSQQTMGGTFLSYVQRDLPAGFALNLTLTGEPQVTNTASGVAAAAPRNQTTELMIGGAALLLAGGGAILVVRARAARREDEEEAAEEEGEVVMGNGRPAAELVQIIAALDEAYEQGDLDETAYRQERAQLMAELKAVWQ